jgi:NADH-quinone oxidoreductase subunit N
MMFLVSTENLLMIFVALEVLSLSLYVLTAFNKRNVRSAEAALKYFLFGGVSAAFLLFGFSLIYGLSGELALPAIAVKLAGKSTDPLLLAAILMILTGLGFKIAAAPFHLWAPDAYEGAPAPSAAFIASGSKVASFFVLARLLMQGLDGAEGSGDWRHMAHGWAPMLAALAALSVVVGNIAAIAQRSVRRLLAFSAVAHAGYALVGVLAQQRADGFASVLFYVATYALTTVGAFGVVALVQDDAGNDHLPAFAGLSRRAPMLSVCLLIFLLSLAGIPPLAGFFGKFYLFKAGLFVAGDDTRSLGLLWLIVLALAMSAVSLYYYLQILKQVFVFEPAPDARPLPSNPAAFLTIGLLAAGVVLLGCAPDLLLSRILTALALP